MLMTIIINRNSLTDKTLKTTYYLGNKIYIKFLNLAMCVIIPYWLRLKVFCILNYKLPRNGRLCVELRHYWQEAQRSQRGRAMLRVIEYFAKSLKVSQGHSKLHCWVGRSIPLNLCLYLVPLLRYSASNDGCVTLKSGVRVVQDRWMWRRSIDHNYTTYYRL